jgi:hypothetical protein
MGCKGSGNRFGMVFIKLRSGMWESKNEGTGMHVIHTPKAGMNLNGPLWSDLSATIFGNFIS